MASLEVDSLSDDEAFITSAGPVDGKSILRDLANRSFLYKLTGKINQKKPIHSF